MIKTQKIIVFLKKHKVHIFLILVMALLIYLRFWDFFSFDNVRYGDSLLKTQMLNFVRRSVLEYHQLPLWYPNEQAGIPFLAHPLYMVLSYSPIMSLIIASPQGMFNFSQLLGVFLSGLFMYILMINLKLKPRFAFISTIFYMFSPLILMLIGAYPEQLQVYVWTPLVFLFLWKAVTKKEWFKNSIIAGVILGIIFLGNGYDASLFLVLLFLSTFLIYIFGKNFLQRVIKVSLISVTILIVSFGLFSIRLLPLLEYNEVSSKKQIEVFSYEQSIGGHNIKNDIKNVYDVIQVFLLPLGNKRDVPERYDPKIGISGLILLIFAFSKWRKKIIMAFIVLTILTLLIALATPVWYIFWKFAPAFDKLHHLDRNMYLYSFATAALIGIGSSILFDKLAKRIKKTNLKVLFLFILSLILIDLFFVSGYINRGRINTGQGTLLKDCLEENYLLHNLSKDTGLFRINNLKTRSHAGNAPAIISRLDLQMLYGGSGIWIPELYTFLGLAHSFPAKFYGMLNTKYLYSNEPVNITNLKFIHKFNESAICNKYENAPTDYGVNGPYLYYNELYLPRAYIADYSILIIGDKNAVDQTTYGLMINNNFNPSNTVIVMIYGKIKDYDMNFLKRFNAIVLTQNSIDQNSGFILEQYVDSGGILLPDLTKGKNTISEEDIVSLFSSFKGSYENVKETNPIYYSPNKIIFKLNGERGFLVLAEKFFMFQGWEPKMNKGKKPIYRANGMNSAVYLEGETGDLKFNYLPKTFKLGLTLTLITLGLILSIFFYMYRSGKRRPNRSNRAKDF